MDAGYCNAQGFLTPYRGQRYHLNEWRCDRQPQTAEEFFNNRHAKARNVIERCFWILKKRWSILTGPSFFPIRTQIRIITACCLLHNFIRRRMTVDPLENEMSDEYEDLEVRNDEDDEDDEVEYITTISPDDHWVNFRNTLAQNMFNEWRARTRR